MMVLDEKHKNLRGGIFPPSVVIRAVVVVIGLAVVGIVAVVIIIVHESS